MDTPIPSKWTKTNLGNVCSVAIGGTPSRAKPELWDREKKTNNLWVSIKDLNKKYIDDTAEYISDEGVRKSNVKRVPKGTTLMSFKLTIGRVAIAGQDLYTNEAIAALIPNGSLSAEYLYYGLQFWDLLRAVDTAVKGSTLNKDKIKTIPISFPTPLSEQKQIATVLSTADEAIEATDILIAKLTRIGQGLTQDLMSRGIDENGKIRSERTHKFRTIKIAGKELRIPQEWDAIMLNQCVSPQRPIVYGILMPGYGHAGGIPVIKVKDISDGQIDQSDLLLTSPAIHHAYRRSVVQEGDLLFTIRGTVGRTAFVPKSLSGANITQDTARIGIVRGDPRFIRYWLHMTIPRAFMAVHTIGVAVKGINLRDVRRIPIVFPPMPEQEKIADMIDQANRIVQYLDGEHKKLIRARHGLMGDLLAGKVHVNQLVNN